MRTLLANKNDLEVTNDDFSKIIRKAIVLTDSYFDRKAAGYRNASNQWPWAWFRRREASVVMDLLGDVRGNESLDLGCGAGYYTELLLQAGASHVTAVDQSRGMINTIQRLSSERITPVMADATKFSTNKHFDRIVCAGVMEFVSEPLDLLRNAYSLAASQAVMVILVPIRTLPARIYRYFHSSHNVYVHLFDPEVIVKVASSASWHCDCYRKCHPFAGAFLLKKL